MGRDAIGRRDPPSAQGGAGVPQVEGRDRGDQKVVRVRHLVTRVRAALWRVAGRLLLPCTPTACGAKPGKPAGDPDFGTGRAGHRH